MSTNRTLVRCDGLLCVRRDVARIAMLSFAHGFKNLSLVLGTMGVVFDTWFEDECSAYAETVESVRCAAGLTHAQAVAFGSHMNRVSHALGGGGDAVAMGVASTPYLRW